MKIKDFASKVAFKEKKKHSATIGDIREILKIINELTDNEFYKLIRKIGNNDK